MAKAYRYTLPDMNFACEVEDGGLLPGNATYTKPKILSGFWPRWTGEAWEQIKDHRERKPPYFAEEYTQEATEYWLPAEGDDWQSQARMMKEAGPLPDGHTLTRPEKPLSAAQTEKRVEIARGYDAALTAAITMPSDNPTPMTVAVETSALLAIDPDAVDSIRTVLDTRRVELLAEVDAARSVATVESIVVNYPV